MIEIKINEDELIRTLENLAQLEATQQGKIIRPSIRAGLKVARTYVQSSLRSTVGGYMGNLMANNLYLKVPKKRRKGISRLMLLYRSDDEFVHDTTHARDRKGRSIRYYIPAAIEYGHRQPYDGKKSAGPSMRKSKVRALRPMKKGWNNAISAVQTTILMTMRERYNSFGIRRIYRNTA